MAFNSIQHKAVKMRFLTLPGLRWLSRSRISLSGLVILTGTVWLLVYWMVGVFRPIFPEAPLLSVVFTALYCVSIGSWFHQLLGSHEDLTQLLDTGSLTTDESMYAQLNGTARQNTFLNLLGAIAGMALYLMGQLISFDIPRRDVIQELIADYIFFDNAPRIIIWEYLALFQFCFIGIALFHGMAGHFRRAFVFHRLARDIAIDLLQTYKLTSIANPVIRGLIAPIVVLAASGPMFFAFDGQLRDTFFLVSVPLALFLFLLAMTSISAVIILRNRIRELKSREKVLIQRYLDGDKEAMNSSRLSLLQSRFSASEVLSYRDRIDAVWEWPFHAHLPRILFYLTIPPMAWAAAALVEQVIDAALT